MTRLAFCHWPNFRTFTFSYQVHRAGRGHSARYKVQQLTRIRQDRRTTLYQSVCYKVTTQSCPVRDCGLWAALHKFIALLQTPSLARPSALQNFACAAALLSDGPAGLWSEIRPQAIMSAMCPEDNCAGQRELENCKTESYSLLQQSKPPSKGDG